MNDTMQKRTNPLWSLMANGIHMFGYLIVIFIIGSCAVRPHWYGFVTKDTVTPEQWEANPKSQLIPDTPPISAIANAPASQSQYNEEHAPVFSKEFVVNLGDSKVTFDGPVLNEQECDYLESKGTAPIDYSEFIASANLFLTGEYFMDSWSVTPLNWYVTTLNQFCTTWDIVRLERLYDGYTTEVSLPAMLLWNGPDAPDDEPVADVRNTHEPRPEIAWINPPQH